MKSFKFRYSVIVWILLGLVMALSLAGLAWNVYNTIAFIGINTLKVATFVAICALALVLLALSISIAVYGRYIVKKDSLTFCLGFIKTKYDINDIVEITHFKKSDKLVVYFADQSYTVVVISPEEYSAFITAVREYNKQIVYSIKIDGEDTPE